MSKQSQRKKREAATARLASKLVPKKSEQENGDNNPPNKDSRIGHSQHIPTGPLSAPALDAIAGFIFFVFAAEFHLAGGWLHIIAFFFDFLVVVCGLTIITHHIEKQKFPLWGRRYWTSLIVVFIVLASLAFYVIRKEDGKPEKPFPGLNTQSVSLELGPNLDTKDPFGQGFVIHSTQPISNTWAEMNWQNVNMKRVVLSTIAANPSPRISQNYSQGLHFSRADLTSPKWDFPPFEARTFVNVEIRYTPAFSNFETNQTFQFCVARKDNGEYVWIPSGEGKDIKSVVAEIHQKSLRAIDIIPFLDVKIIAVENLPQEDKDYPIKISYSWSNIGGRPATAVYIEWAVLDENYMPHMIWNHHGQGFVEMLWPGMSGRVARVYTESPDHDIFNGIISGKYMLVGTVLFMDPEKHQFAMQFKSIKTNNVFEIRCAGLGGYFEEIKKQVQSPIDPAKN